LLKSYNGCIGVKTGFTKKCGRCLVSAAEKDGVTLIAVTLNDPNDWRDHSAMLDYGFDLYESIELDGTISGQAHVVGGKIDAVSYVSSGKVKLSLPRNREEIRCIIEMHRFYYAPIKSGDALGRVVYYAGNDEIASFSIVAVNDVPKPKIKKSIFNLLKAVFK
jgi:D-alanyl-D-alanine carboxypeptidase/D-alanyl-D-alanine carboxypeptidase (penicillin-binding protein 5/6)